MTNFIFKSPRRLTKNIDNTPEVNLILGQLKIVQTQNRLLRQDLVDVKLMINKLLITEHLQMQVDEFYEKPPKVDQADLD